ncbi:DNA polymerase eta isoform X2 [Achroia grisella]|uniref:DNA polymerase eta isoform X2 n=1 Tax=Achroia grisella TaxID=688607 RepID=UPI0027D30CEE|nr:DNA polymerase eta isoform X2 [Achroia grisella]
MDQENRVITLIDMDCFYCQVEEKLNPELKGKPMAVVQYNPWKGGGIIAVNYVARAMGVTRHMRGDEAKEKCPEIQLPSVPCLRGKADITKYRDAGKEVAKVLQKFTPLLERASIDEAYMDITKPVEERLKTLNINMVNSEILPNTYALGYDNVNEFITDVHNCGGECMEFDYEHAKRLLVGSIIVSEIRAAVFKETGYKCSAGIAHNKILAKLVCGMNKPDKQTVLPKHSINILYRTLSLKKVKHLGGKFGDTVCEVLKIKTMAELQTYTEKKLQEKFDEKNGSWLYNIARGIDMEPVQARFNPKSIGCCKQLRGKATVHNLHSLKKWLDDLGDEIDDRLEKDSLENNRTPKQMVVSFTTQLLDGRDTSSSRSYNFASDDELCGELFSSKALELVMDSLEGIKLKGNESDRKLKGPIKFLGISVGKFEDNLETKKVKKIVDYFGAGSSKDINKTNKNEGLNEIKKECIDDKSKDGKEYIINKFFQTNSLSKSTENVSAKVKKENSSATESFFAKFLNNIDKQTTSVEVPKVKILEEKGKSGPPATPTCDVVNHGENSSDSNYSASTINNEINQSIALFDDDLEDVSRVSNMRQLLNTSAIIDESSNQSYKEVEKNKEIESNGPQKAIIHELSDTFCCSECGKTLAIDKSDVHADYHLALKLRDEERQQMRNESKQKNITMNHNTKCKSPVVAENKNEAVTSIASFLVKIDDTVPTEMCAECGKRIPVDKIGEHLDFHEAQKLSREINKKSISCNVNGSSSKRKKASSMGVPFKKSKVLYKSIDSFFR